jgi:hypothetical protein
MFNQTKACFLFTLLVISFAVQAQEKDTASKEKSYFKAELNYVSNSIYLGRKDSATLPYITPSIGYYHKSGFYASGSAAYSTTDKRFDYFSLDAGYEFNISSKLAGSVYANKSFYNDSSSNVSSDIGAGLGAGLSYDFGFVELHGGVDISFASKTDYGLNFSVAHTFDLDEDGGWTIAPNALVNFNTLNFYEGYTNRTNGKKQKLKNPLVTSVASTTTITNKKANDLTLMDYEINVPISYEARKWGLYFTPTLAIPQNAIYTSTTSVITFRSPPAPNPTQTNTMDSTPSSEKNLKSVFYAEVGVYFKF